MHLTINHAYPWGRSFEEYRRMFSLSEADWGGRILGCADGPASFNLAMRRRGGRVISCDPLYQFSGEEIASRVDATRALMVELTRREPERFVWTCIGSPEELGRVRMEAMEEFLTDYEAGRVEGRYVAGSLPELPFGDGSFDLALCSHFLFLYSEELSFDMHMRSVRELCRVAREVRIFPLLDMKGRRSEYVERVIAELGRQELAATVEGVDYEFQRGGNEMMRIVARREDCVR
jgi:hypothetical protein